MLIKTLLKIILHSFKEVNFLIASCKFYKSFYDTCWYHIKHLHSVSSEKSIKSFNLIFSSCDMIDKTFYLFMVTDPENYDIFWNIIYKNMWQINFLSLWKFLSKECMINKIWSIMKWYEARCLLIKRSIELCNYTNTIHTIHAYSINLNQ